MCQTFIRNEQAAGSNHTERRRQPAYVHEHLQMTFRCSREAPFATGSGSIAAGLVVEVILVLVVVVVVAAAITLPLTLSD